MTSFQRKYYCRSTIKSVNKSNRCVCTNLQFFSFFIIAVIIRSCAGDIDFNSFASSPEILQIAETLGNPCYYHTGYGDLKGECKFITTCDVAVADYKIKRQFQECAEGMSIVACCPLDPRISDIKCEEYKNHISDSEPAALAPVEVLKAMGLWPPKPECRPQLVTHTVNGENAYPWEFPHMVALGYGDENSGEWYCGGTLISENFVLTAAHCIYTGDYGPVRRVLLGAHKLSDVRKTGTGIQTIKVAQTFKHPDYIAEERGGEAVTIYNDIALIKLKENAKLSSHIRPACLPQPKLRLDKIEHVQVTGWGFNTSSLDGPQVQSDILQKVSIKVQDPHECETDEFKNAVPQGLKSSQICAGDPKLHRDSCGGDSGGPMVVTVGNMTCLYYVTGVVSAGSQICGFKSAIYTNVQYHLDWIESMVWGNKMESN